MVSLKCGRTEQGLGSSIYAEPSLQPKVMCWTYRVSSALSYRFHGRNCMTYYTILLLILFLDIDNIIYFIIIFYLSNVLRAIAADTDFSPVLEG